MSFFVRYYSFLLAFVFLLSANHCLAQSLLPDIVERELNQRKADSYSLFTRDTVRSASIDAEIRNVTYLSLDTKKLKALLQQRSPLIILEIPLADGSSISAQLVSYDFRSRDYRDVIYSGNRIQPLTKEDALFYRGSLKGASHSFAAFSFFDDEIGGVFSDSLKGNFNLVLNREHPGEEHQHYVLYREADIVHPERAGCAMTEQATDMLKHNAKTTDLTASGRFTETCKAVRVSVFADSILYVNNGKSSRKTIQYVQTLFNIICALYANDELMLQLSETVLLTGNDRFYYVDSYSLLHFFQRRIYGYAFNGDLAQLMTGYKDPNTGATLGGIAILNVLCARPRMQINAGDTAYTGPFSVSNVKTLASLPALPVYSWDVDVCAHELGHNIGSPHTHSCTWPTGAIDDCFEPEGDCARGPKPINGGTIMSYCHLTSSGINFANGFGPQPKALLQSSILDAVCLGSGVADSVSDSANRTVVANAECYDGLWTQYFFDNNTADVSDDVFVMAINKLGQNIGSVRDKDFVLAMTTNQWIGRDTVPELQVAYADSNWRQINRRWTVQLPAGKQPKARVIVRYPYSERDIKDLSYFIAPQKVPDTLLTFLQFLNNSPVINPNGIGSGDVRRRYQRSDAMNNPFAWRFGLTSGYRYVELSLDSGVFGGLLGYQIKDRPARNGDLLVVYPNPTDKYISVVLSQEMTGDQDVRIFDNLGRVVLSARPEILLGAMVLDVTLLQSGVYTVQCTDVGTQRKKFALFVKS